MIQKNCHISQLNYANHTKLYHLMKPPKKKMIQLSNWMNFMIYARLPTKFNTKIIII